jgi:hypothetical protein
MFICVAQLAEGQRKVIISRVEANLGCTHLMTKQIGRRVPYIIVHKLQGHRTATCLTMPYSLQVSTFPP